MQIQYFGEIAEIANSTSEEVVLKELTLEGLKSYLVTTYNMQLEDIRIAINHEIVTDANTIDLKETDKVAILSPFAGG
jgi:molybdopterin converting factor small subunit